MDATNRKWTADRVRQELPNVRVRVGNRVSFAVVRGRELPFASVKCDEFPGTFQRSWETIARCLEDNRPIIA